MSTERSKAHRVAKILVPTDFSASSEAALDYASFLGGRFAADIDVLYVWNLSAGRAEHGRRIHFFGDSPAGRSMQRALSAFSTTGLQLRGRVAFGKLSSTIVDIASTDNFDLIVMGLHEHVLGTHFFTEHLARKVARDAPCPVITVREPHMEEDEGSLEMSASLERWLDDGGVGIDMDPSSPPVGVLR